MVDLKESVTPRPWPVWRIDAVGLSDRGLKREHNEDSLSVVQDLGLWIVADGMGGHNAGEVASRQAIECIVDFIARSRDSGEAAISEGFDPELGLEENLLRAAVRAANRDVCHLALEHQEYAGMGTTLVAMLFDGVRVAVAHVGDSRCYRMRGGELEQLTLDHSWVSEQLQKKIITPEEARAHRWKNVITRALGNRLDVEIDVQGHLVEPGDTFLLCSDGLCGMIENDQIAEVLMEKPELEGCVEALIDAANEAGGVDNISVVVVRFLPDPGGRAALASDGTA